MKTVVVAVCLLPRLEDLRRRHQREKYSFKDPYRKLGQTQTSSQALLAKGEGSPPTPVSSW